MKDLMFPARVNEGYLDPTLVKFSVSQVQMQQACAVENKFKLYFKNMQ